MTGNRLTVVAVALFAITVIGVVVLVAVGLDKLGVLMLGVAALGGIVVLLALIAALILRWSAKPLSIIGDVRLSLAKEQNVHDEEMVKSGHVVNDPRYRFVGLQIAAPKEQQSGVSQIILNPNALRESAVNLLLFSIQQIGENQNRIASGPECFEAHVNGYSGRTWSKIVNEFLAPRYGVVTQPGNPKNGGGTYVPEKYGTVGALYHRVMLDSAVDELPGVIR